MVAAEELGEESPVKFQLGGPTRPRQRSQFSPEGPRARARAKVRAQARAEVTALAEAVTAQVEAVRAVVMSSRENARATVAYPVCNTPSKPGRAAPEVGCRE